MKEYKMSGVVVVKNGITIGKVSKWMASANGKGTMDGV